jgi:hypothetical protein
LTVLPRLCVLDEDDAALRFTSFAIAARDRFAGGGEVTVEYLESSSFSFLIRDFGDGESFGTIRDRRIMSGMNTLGGSNERIRSAADFVADE